MRNSLAERKYEDVVDYCAGEGIVFVQFFPLRGVGSRQLSEIARPPRSVPAQIATFTTWRSTCG